MDAIRSKTVFFSGFFWLYLFFKSAAGMLVHPNKYTTVLLVLTSKEC